jgi:hypothetical protein
MTHSNEWGRNNAIFLFNLVYCLFFIAQQHLSEVSCVALKLENHLFTALNFVK